MSDDRRRGLDELRATFKRRRETARILFDHSLVEQHRALTARHDNSLRGTDLVDDAPLAVDALTTMPDELARLEAEIDDAEQEFVFESIGRGRWLRLIAENPPTGDDIAGGWEYHADTFVPAALQASCVSHALTSDDAWWLMEELDIGEFSRLWAACYLANAGEALRPKSVAASVIRSMRGRSWGTAAPEESLAPSSADA